MHNHRTAVVRLDLAHHTGTPAATLHVAQTYAKSVPPTPPAHQRHDGDAVVETEASIGVNSDSQLCGGDKGSVAPKVMLQQSLRYTAPAYCRVYMKAICLLLKVGHHKVASMWMAVL